MFPARPSLHSACRALAALTLSTGLAACGPTGAEAARPAATEARSVLVQTGPVGSGPVERSWSAVGSLRANESVVVRPEISGRIARIAFDEGERVERRAVLFALDASVYEAELAQARANLALAERNARRAAELFERQLIPTAERDATAAALDMARAAVQLAEAELAKTRIEAPFSGRVGLRSVAIGDYVTPGQDLVSLEDLDRIKLDFRLPELALADARAGQALSVELDAYPGERFEGELYAVDSRVAEATRSFAVRARLDNPDGRLWPGLFARIRLVVGRQDDAMLVPEQALLMRADRAYVFVVEDGRARQREVRLGLRRGGQAQVIEGLDRDQTIVVSGVQGVADGTRVHTADAPSPQPAG